MPSQTGSIDLTAQVSANNNAKDYSDNVVDNLVVGGRNLFVSGSASNGYPTDAAVGNAYGVSNMSANHEAYEKIPVEEESSYIVQYWVDDSAHAGWVCIQLLDSSDVIKNKICRTYPAADYWTTTIDIPTGVSQMLVSGRHLASGYAYAKIKVEKGNKATDWTPAPEDQEAFSISSGVEYIEGTQSAATNLWTGVTKESSLVSGKTISYKLPFAGNNSAATLNLTLSDGSTTGAKAVKQIYTTASNTGALADITTHWPVGSVIPMTYDGTRWIVQNYNTNVDHYDRIQHNNTLKSATEKATGKNYAIVASSLIGYISSLSGYQTILGGSIVDISKPLLWGTGNVNVSTTFTNAYEIYPSQTVRNNASGSWTGTTFSMVYLFGTLNGTNLTVDSTVFTCTIPITEDGKVYIPIGILYSEYQISFRTTSDIYAYKDGEFGKLSLREASAASKTATNYISADANGISIHMANESNTYQRQTSDSTTFYVGGKKRSQVGADGLKVYVGTTETEMASFGTSARIGKAYVEGATDNESHLELDYRSMRLSDKEGNEFFEVEDLRNRNGVYSVAETVTYEEPGEEGLEPAVIQQYDFPMRVTGFSVTLDDDTDDTANWNLHHVTSPGVYSYITRDNGTVYGDVTFYGETNSSNAKMLTFGTRNEELRFGEGSVAMGNLVAASGRWSHAEGSETRALGESSHSEGRQTIANYYCAHAEGWNTKANDTASHAEGIGSVASGRFSHAEGSNTSASGEESHAEGEGTKATGLGAHSEGWYAKANGNYSHAQNNHTIAAYEAQTTIGKWNYNDPDNAFEIGNGLGTVSSSYQHRSNAFAVTWDGDLTYQGRLHGSTWLAGTSGTPSGGVTTLPSSGTYILVTAHNSTPALNGIWIVRTGGNTAFKIASGGNVTVTVSGTTLTVTTTAGTVNVYYQFCG